MGVRFTSLTLCSGIALAAACGSGSPTTVTPTSCAAGAGTPITLGVGAYTVVDPATDSGCVHFAANAGIDSTEYLVVAQSAAGTTGQSAPFSLKGGAAAVAASLVAGANPPANRSPIAVQFDWTLRQMARTGNYPAVPAALQAAAPARVITAAPPTPPTVGSVRVFKVCSNLACSALKNVAAKARVVGLHIAVYVDTLAPAAGLDSAELDSLKQVFDTRLYPLDTTAFGGVSDIDNNSVVIVLMTGVVNSLVTRTQCEKNGFVAGFFAAGDLNPPTASQFNDGEIFYSVVADPDSTLSCPHTAGQLDVLTPVTFVHEFQHMISFVQHVLVRGGAPEEGWLDEGLSKYAEELAGRSYLPGNPQQFSNYLIGDLYDAYQYLNAPSASPLLIPEDNGTLADIGASWLFTRYIVDQFGDSLPHRLHTTTLVGSANVAAQTGQPFTTTVTRWALANWVSDLPGFTAPSELQYTSWHFRTSTYPSLNSQDPGDFPLTYPLVPTPSGGATVSVSGTLTSGSGAYVRLFQPPQGAAFSLHFTKDGATALPAALTPRLDIIRIR